MSDDEALVEEVRRKTDELEQVLEDFGDRLRRLRRRNREVEQDLAAFEQELERLRKRLSDG